MESIDRIGDACMYPSLCMYVMCLCLAVGTVVQTGNGITMAGASLSPVSFFFICCFVAQLSKADKNKSQNEGVYRTREG